MKQRIVSGSLGLIALILVCLVGITSCGSTASISGGLSDEAYIVLTANRAYINETVHIQIDGAESIPVKAVAEDKKARNGRRIVIKPGKHRLVVFDRKGNVIYNQHIFVSTRNAKTVVLP